jgi:hypothetical protein
MFIARVFLNILDMNQLNNEGFFNLNNLEGEEEDELDIIHLRTAIEELRANGCNNVADLLAKELQELRK